MRVAERLNDVTDKMQSRRLESKRDSLDRDNDRLRTELRITREELAHERGARDELLEALKRGGEGSVRADTVKIKKIKARRRGGLVRLLVVGGGAYVLGTRAGRERFEQIKGWASDMRDRTRGADDDGWTPLPNGGPGATGTGGTTSGMSGTSGSATGSGSTSTGSGSTGTGSGSTSTGSGSTSTGSSGSGSTSTGAGATGTTPSTRGRGGSSTTPSGS